MIDPQDIQSIADLARLKLSPSELEQFTQEISRITDYISELSSIELNQKDVRDHVLPFEQNFLRDDHVCQSLPQASLFKGAPSHEAGYIKVPKMLEE